MMRMDASVIVQYSIYADDDLREEAADASCLAGNVSAGMASAARKAFSAAETKPPDARKDLVMFPPHLISST